MAHPVFVSDAVARETLAWPDMIATLRKVYSVEHLPSAGPPRTLARGKGIWMRTLTGVLPSGGVMGVKQFCFPRGQARALHDQPVRPGERRAPGALGRQHHHRLAHRRHHRHGARPHGAAGTTRVAMLGSGAEARSHARAIASVRPIENMAVYSPNPERRELFARTFAGELGVPVRAVASARAAVEGGRVSSSARRARSTASRCSKARGSNPACWSPRSARPCPSISRSTCRRSSAPRSSSPTCRTR